MEKNFATLMREAVERRQQLDKSKMVIPTPEELREKVVMDMILFNSRHGRFNSADN